MKDCNACGKCCIKYGDGGLSVSHQEIEQWLEDSPAIAKYVHNGQIWFDPKSKQQLHACPWLQPVSHSNSNKISHYTCAIYFNRPDDCRYYPSTLDEMIRDECEMLEPQDLRNTKQAQKALEIIMKDSWV